jgi:hypothetical protein
MCVRQPEHTGAWLSGSLPLETRPPIYRRGKCGLPRPHDCYGTQYAGVVMKKS